jgi:RNA polymerase sigma-70 factor (ECF subfamily)
VRGHFDAMTVRSLHAEYSLLKADAPLSCEETVTRLFEESRQDVYRYLLTLSLAPGQAQEATQEVFLRLYVALRRGERIENPRAWIFRVAHNHGSHVRSREDHTRPLDPEIETLIEDRRENPEQTLLQRERHARFHSALHSLSEQQRNCLFLRAEGFRYREIAGILGVSDSTVGEFLRRAITRLRKVLHD